MRALRRALAGVLLVGALTTGAGAAAGPEIVVVEYVWTGTAYQQGLYYANTSSGRTLTSTTTQQALWYESCSARLSSTPRTGQAVLCRPADRYVFGRVDFEDLSNSTGSCTASVSATPGYPAIPIGGSVDGARLHLLAGAPIFQGTTVRRSGNPLEAACEGLNLFSPGGRKTYDMRDRSASWPYSSQVPKTWTGSLPTTLTTARFNGTMVVNPRGFGAGDPRAVLYRVTDAIDTWVDSALYGRADPGVWLDFGQSGLLDAFADASDPIRLFTVRRNVAAGRTYIALQLTPQGSAFLRSDPAPRVRVHVAFTPAHGSRASLDTRVSPHVFPSISSVRFEGTPSNPTVIVHGRGLAPLPGRDPAGSPVGHDGCPSTPGDYGADYGGLFNLEDLSGGWSAGLHDEGAHVTSCIGIVPTKVTAGEVDFRLGAFYTQLFPKFSLSAGDDVVLVTNGAAAHARVAYS